MEPTRKPEQQPAKTPTEREPVVPPTVQKASMSTGKTIVHTSNLVTIAGFALAILLAVVGSTWNLRGFITSEIEDATATTSARLKSAIADIRQEIQASRESSDRQMAEIRRFIFERYSKDDENDQDDDIRN